MSMIKVSPLKWGTMLNSYIGASTVTLQAIGVDTDYSDVCGLSGFAFKLNMYQPEFCPSSVDATCGFDCSTVLWSVYGYRNLFLGCDTNKQEELRRVRMAVVRQLHRGIPVPAIGMRVADEWGVACGEDQNGEKLLCHTYFDSTDEAVPADKFPWIAGIVDGQGGKRPDRASYIVALKRAAMLARRPEYKPYHSGWRAYKTWIGQLENEGWCAANPKFDRNMWQFVNSYMLGSVADGRKQAAVCLERWSKRFSGSEEARLRQAAENYRKEQTMLEDAVKQTPSNGTWTEIQRRNQAKQMKSALAYDQRAIQCIEQVVGV